MAVKVETPVCPACASKLSEEGRSAGLCPSCLLELALDDTSLEVEVRVEPGEAPTLQFTPDFAFSEGTIQGDRYRIRSLLGRGGMGEVWRAYDLKLRQDVALKALRTELIRNPEALETLRQEVRVAREVISPNVCRVYDLEELDGQELISMEYVDGTTLQEILRDRGPLDLNEAREIASQFLAGLEAIHEAGLIHRDIKPENLMITRTGRVVVMDFGIAKGLGTGGEQIVVGTPAYMSPEQTRGQDLDVRADLFSAGVVLAEMVEPGGLPSFEDRQRVWKGIHQEDPQLSETPWSKVIAEAVALEREERYSSALALARALEEVTLRAAGDDTGRPYPGLSAFQEEDAEFFYGRELEVEALWKKLRRPHLLAVIGPSGAGKSSFLQAGLLPTLLEGWRAIVTTPGSQPFKHLALALEPELVDAPGAADLLPRFAEPGIAVELLSDWRQAHQHALVIIDQFEELFTQNLDEVQASFAELLGSLPLAADVHVLLSMRDDFLMHCHHLEALRPVFSELSPLDPPLGASLRRALVEPALKCGYHFEDEAMVEEMLGEVEGQRAALPMLAFAAAQLWERRDREKGLLTREAYEQIGGVGGALAQHAEATLEQIGDDGIPIVRELFRNLVTAQGTRAARDREDLLSVFGDFQTVEARTEAGHYEYRDDVGAGLAPAREGARPSPTRATTVLDALIDARLLTSYEVPAADEEHPPHHRVEIVHESLLSHWPRLVRWQMQDAEGAQLRDELLSQARLWDEHSRSSDYLWTGAAYLDFLAWRKRYPGGLTTLEEAFSEAMTRHAERRKRRRRLAATAVFAILLAVLAVVGGLWRQSDRSRKEAVAEARRAEGAKLLALGRLELETLPTASVAYALASLEMADTEEARRFAVEALWRRPTATILTAPGASDDWTRLNFSPDGRWLALGGTSQNVLVWSQEGGSPRPLGGHGPEAYRFEFSPEGELLYTWSLKAKRLRVFSTRDWNEVQSQEFDRPTSVWPRGDKILTFTMTPDETTRLVRSWPLGGGAPTTLASWNIEGLGAYDVDPSGSFLGYGVGKGVYLRSLAGFATSHESLAGRHDADVFRVTFDPSGEYLASLDRSGEIRLWSLAGQSGTLLRTLEAGPGVEAYWVDLAFDPTGSKLAFISSDEGVRLWDLDGPPHAEPVFLHDEKSAYFWECAFHPSGRWLAAAAGPPGAVLWPLGRPYAKVLEGHSAEVMGLVFGPGGKWLASASFDGTVRRWPMSAGDGQKDPDILFETRAVSGLAIDPQGERLLVGETQPPVVSVVPLGQGAPRRLPGFTTAINMMGVAFSADGRLAAAGPGLDREGAVIRVWDLDSSAVRVFDPGANPSSELGGADHNVTGLGFLSDRRLVSTGFNGIRLWDLDKETSTVLYENRDADLVMSALSSNRRSMLFFSGSGSNRPVDLFYYDLDSGHSHTITSHGVRVTAVALDPSGTIAVTGDLDGVVRVGAVTGEEPHLLLGHQRRILRLSVSPDGRWIASSDQEGTIRLWPMPNLSKPPLHSLPVDDLLGKLRSLTNLRVVESETSATGYTVEPGPFPGWQEVPTWQ